MNFDFSEDQATIKRTARELLAARYPLEEVRRLALEDPQGFTDAQWQEVAELGWPGLAVAEAHGGMGLGIVELAAVAEELGYALAPTPLQASWMAALLLSGADDPPAELLRGLASGERRGSVALAQDEDGGWLVPHAATAEVLVVEDQVLDGGFEAEPVPSFDPTRRIFRVRGGNGTPLAGDLSRALDVIRVVLAAESTGLAQRCLEMSVEYAKERRQFGRPIGTFQAVSHRCAQMLLEIEGARSLVYNAAWALDHAPDEAPVAAAMAKAYASDCGSRVASAAIQVHGGIGFTWESDLHFFLKRADANARAFGTPLEMRRAVIDARLPVEQPSAVGS